MKRTALATVFVLGIAMVAAVAAGGAAGSTTQAEADANASFGAEVSSFMQASSAETAGDVDDELFAAELNRTEDPDERKAVIEERESTLQARQERLEARQAALNDSGPVAQYAIATEVAVASGELAESANRTERAAAAAGLNTTALAEIRANANEMHGRTVAEIAGGIAGPPTDVPGGENGNESAADDNRSNAGNASENPGDGGAEGNDDGGDKAGGPDDGSDVPPGDEESTDEDA